MYIALLVGGLLLILCGVGYGGVVDIHVMMMFGGMCFHWFGSGLGFLIEFAGYKCMRRNGVTSFHGMEL